MKTGKITKAITSILLLLFFTNCTTTKLAYDSKNELNNDVIKLRNPHYKERVNTKGKTVGWSSVIGTTIGAFVIGENLDLIKFKNKGGTGSGADFDGVYENSIDLNPHFIDFENRDFRLNSDSYSIDSGTESIEGIEYPQTDFDGNARRYGSSKIDMGAYEFIGNHTYLEPVRIVKRDRFNQDPFKIEVSCLESYVDIRYTTNGTDPDETSELYSSELPLMIGSNTKLKIKGYKEGFTPTPIDSVEYLFGYELKDSLSGTLDKKGLPYFVTGDIFVATSDTLHIKKGARFEFLDNYEFIIKGRIFADGQPFVPITFTQYDTTAFYDTTPNGGWGGISIKDNMNNNKFYGCVFKYVKKSENGNYTYGENGGVFNISNSKVSITSSILLDNYGKNGSSIFAENSEVFFANNLVKNSRASEIGVINLKNTIFSFLNNTIVANKAKEASAILLTDCQNPNIMNNIFWDNVTSNNNKQIVLNNTTNANILYNTLELGVETISISSNSNANFSNNFQFYPDFNENTYSGYEIQSYSPCINGGIPDTTGLNIPYVDLSGNARIYDGEVDRIDIGAYEFVGEPDGSPIISFEPSNISFGFVKAGKTVFDTLVIVNSGNKDMNITDIEFMNSGEAVFGVSKFGKSKSFEFTIPSHQKDSIIVKMTPIVDIDSSYVSKLKISSTELTSPLYVDISGNGIFGTYIDKNTVSGIWTKENNPYNILRDIEIDTSLVINKGVEVKFYNYSSLRIAENDKITVNGTEDEKVLFTIADTSGFDLNPNTIEGGWGGIYFSNSGSDDTFNNSIIEYVKKIRFDTNSSIGEDSAFVAEETGAIYLQNSSPVIKNSEIINNRGYGSAGVYGKNYCNPYFENVDISKNIASISTLKYKELFSPKTFYYRSGSLFFVNNSNPTMKNVGVTNNFLKVGAQGCTNMSGQTALVLNSSTAKVVNSTFVGNNAEYGIVRLNNSSSPIIINSIIWNEGNLISTTLDDDGSDPNIFDSDFVNGLSGILYYDSLKYVSSTNKNIYTGTFKNNMNFDPEFAKSDPLFGYVTYYKTPYELRQQSPCINAGRSDLTGLNLPLKDLLNNDRVYNNYRVDLGAYEYQGNATGNAIINLGSTSIDFKYCSSGKIKKDTLIIHNYGNSGLDIQSFEFENSEGEFGVEFFDGNTNLSYIPEHSKDSIIVVFKPVNTDILDYSDRLFIVTSIGTKALKIIGTGVDGTLIEAGLVSGDWNKSGEPYHVMGDIEVDNSLAVHAGVNVIFHGFYGLTVSENDKLEVIGTELEKVRFTAADSLGFEGELIECEDGWSGIRFKNSGDDDIINYAIFEYGNRYLQKDEVNDDSTKVYGGSVYANNTSLVIKNSHFRKNIANKGGAIYFDNSSSAKIENCIFKENYSFMVTVNISHNIAEFTYTETFTYPGYGGAISSYNSDLIITNSRFNKNKSEYGGAIFAENSIFEQYNSVYSENRSSRTGGAIRINKTEALFSNLTLAWNRSVSGGGISIYRSSPVIINSIFRDNITETNGAEIFVSDLDNDNTYSFPNIQYNNIEGGLTGIGMDKYKDYEGVYYANMDFDPNFVAETPNPLAIKENSSCINAGTSSLVELLNLPEIDIAGNSRIYDGIIDRLDIGAYEYQGEATGTPLIDTDVTDIDFWYQPAGKDTTVTLKIFNHGNVLTTVSDILFDGSNYSFSTFDKKTKGGKSKRDITFRSVKLNRSLKGKSDVFDIQSHSLDSIKVTFLSDLGKNIRYEDKLAVISNGQENKFVNLEGYGLLGTVIYGGEVGDANWIKANSPYDIIGNIDITGSLTIEAGCEVIIYDYEAITVVESGKLLVQGTENDLVTFASGDPDKYSNINTLDGGWGGIRFISSGSDDRISFASFKHGKKLINDHWFSGSANKNGGALFFENTSAIVDNSIFENNSAENGGAISFVNPEGSSSVIDCEFRSNNAVNGGAVYNFNSNGKLIRGLLENNLASKNGGALYCEGEKGNVTGEFKVIGNKFLSNISTGDGGAFYSFYSSPRLESNIIAKNTGAMGGGMYIHFSSPTIINCTIASNIAESVGGGVYVYKTSNPHFYNSIIYNNSAPRYIYGKIVLDPQFHLIVDPNKQVISHSYVTLMYSYISKPKFDYTNLQGEDRNIIHFTESVTPSGTTYFRNLFDERYYKNVECNPEFNNDFSLKNTSPCIDLGMEDISSLNLVNYDAFNSSRIKTNTIIDLGAVEFQNTNIPKPVLTHRVDEIDFGGLYAEKTSTLMLHYYNSGNKVLNVTDEFLENDTTVFTISKSSPGHEKFSKSRIVSKIGRNNRGANIHLEIPVHGKDSLFITFSPTDSIDQHYFDNIISRADNPSSKYMVVKGHGIVKPDLVITEIIPPATANSGEKITVSWIIKNRGVSGTNVSGWEDKVFLTMAEDSLDFMDEIEGAVDLGSFDNTSFLLPGESYKSIAEVTLPEGLQGIFRIGVKSDFKNDDFFEGLKISDGSDGIVDERNESNNISISTDSIALALTLPPDLQVESMNIPSFARSGSEITVDYRVVNVGENPTNEDSSWKDKIYFSKDSIFNNSALLLHTYIRNGQLLNGNHGTNIDSSYTVSVPIRLPHKAQGNHSATTSGGLLTELGDCFIYVVTDAENDVEEHIYEGNNRNLRSLRLNIIPPDYEAKELIVPDTVFSGKDMNITWNVKNNGPGINNDYYEKYWKDRIYISSDEVLTQVRQ